MHHTKEKGDIGLLAVLLDLSLKGYKVFTSNSEHLPFDLIAYREGGIFLRIQVKYRKIRNGRIDITSRTSWADKNGSHDKPYNKNELDYFAVYCPDNDKCYYIGINDFDKSFTLRFEDTRNNNITKIRFAKDYEEI